MLYVIDLHNHIASSNNPNHCTPIQVAFGHQPDISKFLQFHWWQKVLYLSDTHKFPSDTYEGIGHFVGIANHIGDVLTYYILQDSTQKVIARSMVRPLDVNNPNLRVYVPSDEGRILDFRLSGLTESAGT